MHAKELADVAVEEAVDVVEHTEADKALNESACCPGCCGENTSVVGQSRTGLSESIVIGSVLCPCS